MNRAIHLLNLLPLLVILGCSPSQEGMGPFDTATPTPTPTPTPAPSPLPPEIRTAAIQRGRSIAGEAFSLLSSNLQTALQQGGVSNALPYCSLAASPLTAGIATRHGVTLRRVTHKPRQPTAKADPAELAILEQFQAALAVTNAPPPVVTNLLPAQVAFFAPIVLNNALCLNCHGEPGRDIAPENVALIRRLYPRDEATGFKLGDLRGAWRIDFPWATLTESN